MGHRHHTHCAWDHNTSGLGLLAVLILGVILLCFLNL